MSRRQRHVATQEEEDIGDGDPEEEEEIAEEDLLLAVRKFQERLQIANERLAIQQEQQHLYEQNLQQLRKESESWRNRYQNVLRENELLSMESSKLETSHKRIVSLQEQVKRREAENEVLKGLLEAMEAASKSTKGGAPLSSARSVNSGSGTSGVVSERDHNKLLKEKQNLEAEMASINHERHEIEQELEAANRAYDDLEQKFHQQQKELLVHQQKFQQQQREFQQKLEQHESDFQQNMQQQQQAEIAQQLERELEIHQQRFDQQVAELESTIEVQQQELQKLQVEAQNQSKLTNVVPEMRSSASTNMKDEVIVHEWHPFRNVKISESTHFDPTDLEVFLELLPLESRASVSHILATALTLKGGNESMDEMFFMLKNVRKDILKELVEKWVPILKAHPELVVDFQTQQRRILVTDVKLAVNQKQPPLPKRNARKKQSPRQESSATASSTAMSTTSTTSTASTSSTVSSKALQKKQIKAQPINQRVVELSKASSFGGDHLFRGPISADRPFEMVVHTRRFVDLSDDSKASFTSRPDVRKRGMSASTSHSALSGRPASGSSCTSHNEESGQESEEFGTEEDHEEPVQDTKKKKKKWGMAAMRNVKLTKAKSVMGNMNMSKAKSMMGNVNMAKTKSMMGKMNMTKTKSMMGNMGNAVKGARSRVPFGRNKKSKSQSAAHESAESAVSDPRDPHDHLDDDDDDDAWLDSEIVFEEGNFACNNCQKTPIDGLHYTCCDCDSYRLCADCYATGCHGMENSDELFDRANDLLADKCELLARKKAFCGILRYEICGENIRKYEFVVDWISELLNGCDISELEVTSLKFARVKQQFRRNFVEDLNEMLAFRQDLQLNSEWEPVAGGKSEDDPNAVESLHLWVVDDLYRDSLNDRSSGGRYSGDQDIYDDEDEEDEPTTPVGDEDGNPMKYDQDYDDFELEEYDDDEDYFDANAPVKRLSKQETGRQDLLDRSRVHSIEF